MKKTNLLLTLCFCCQLAFAQSQKKPLIVKEFKLENGMTVWINEDHSLSKIFGAVVINAGGKDSPNTGIAHYLEHLLFKGTEKIGTTDYAAEKIILDKIEEKYEQLSKTASPHERSEIQSEINALSLEASDYAIPNEFDRLISKYGGNELNAFTSYDITAYHNSFSPQYLKQWAELNSERLLKPVFRLFQNELEAVYEEKNMYMDAYATVFEKLMERFFSPHPYMYSIIGSSENLKNPRLEEMRNFFNDYYVGGNMALILSGDIDAEQALPIIKETFGRLPAGNAPKKEYQQPKAFQGRETLSLKIPIPLVKASAFCWRTVPEAHEDKLYLTLAVNLLSNSNNTGFLNKLSVEQKVMMADVFCESMNDAGAAVALVIPKLIGQSNKKAKELLMGEINRLKTGDFSEEDLENVKLEFKREFEENLEDPDSRAQLMIKLFSQNRSWDDFLKQMRDLDKCTKKKIIEIANRYFSDNYLEVTKKTGKYPKDILPKPNFEPILPKHKDSESVYAKELGKMPIEKAQPRFLNFTKDVRELELSSLSKLYIKENPLNDIFSLKIIFLKGEIESNLLSPLSTYLDFLGTDSLSFDDFRQALQNLGSTLSFNAKEECFEIEMSGFDKNFEASAQILSHFLRRVEADKEKMRQLTDAKKIEDRATKETPALLAEALLKKVVYGENSSFLRQISLSELKKLKPESLIDAFHELQQMACEIHYCGNIPAEQVKSIVTKTVDIAKITKTSNNPVYQEPKEHKERCVFFLHIPKLAQSTIFLYTKGGINKTQHARNASELFSSYFGGNMSSILFQEIREFRSWAYGVSASYKLSNNRHRDKPGFFYSFLSTQSDKTIEAISLLDSLVQNMPIKPERVAIARQDIINDAYNNYPAFRDLSETIGELKRNGYTSDPNELLIKEIDELGMNEIEEFYEENIKGRPLVYIVVGDKKKIDMKTLAQFGKIIEVKAKEVYR